MSMEFTPTIYIGAGAVIAALISGFWSFINLVISKDQKVSEFRQSWIDSFRNEVSDFASATHSIHIKWCCNYRINEMESSDKFRLENATEYERVFSLSNKIKLRLNPEESEDILTAINDLERFISTNQGINDYDLITDTSNDLINFAQVMLKKEWNRVKIGEKSFKYTKNIVGVFILLLVVFSVIYLT